MNQEIDIDNASPNDIYEYLKQTGSVTFTMNKKEEKLFKKGCKGLDLMYKNMLINGGFFHKLSKLLTIPLLVIGVHTINWYRSLGSKVVTTALEIYERSWHDIDFVQVTKANSNNLHVHLLWLKKV